MVSTFTNVIPPARSFSFTNRAIPTLPQEPSVPPICFPWRGFGFIVARRSISLSAAEPFTTSEGQLHPNGLCCHVNSLDSPAAGPSCALLTRPARPLHSAASERVAQVVEHVTFNHGVEGSSSSALTKSLDGSAAYRYITHSSLAAMLVNLQRERDRHRVGNHHWNGTIRRAASLSHGRSSASGTS